MAISKNRLEELIKQSATIYWLAGEMVLNIHLDSSYYVSDANILCHKRSEDEKNCVEHIENLYETQKQAEWYLKYHATRTEELNLPMWEGYYDTKDTIFWCEMGVKVCLRIRPSFIDVRLDNKEVVFNGEATEENYEKACDLCLKLFKGEQE